MKLQFLNDVDFEDRARVWIVFLVAAVVIALETVSFQAVVYVTEYLLAMQVVSVALMGIALGGLLSFFFSKKNPDTVIGIILAIFPFAIISTYFIVARLSSTPMLMMGLMTIPYILASLLISIMFNRMKPSLVYLFDLAGAGVGAVLVVVLIPPLREEGSLLFLTLLTSLPILLFHRMRKAQGKGRLFFTYGTALAFVTLVLIVLHLTLDPFNLLLNSEVDRIAYPRKIFHQMGKRWELRASRGSLVERIDIVRGIRGTGSRNFFSIYNARNVDLISGFKPKIGDLDNRFPTRLKLGTNPETLLVGPSGVGLCKAVQALGHGHVDAVEINGAIANLMTGRFHKTSGGAYDGFNLSIGDVRTFLETTDRKYDFITLLNTHRIWSMGHTGAPEYCHTVEAMRAYIDHLKPDGFLIFEERNVNEQADLATRKLVHTATQVLKERGVTEPDKNIGIWELWHGCTKERWNRRRCRRKSQFTFLMVKPTPISQAEYEHFVEWADLLAARKPGKHNNFRGIEWQYLPQNPSKHYWTEVVRASSVEKIPGLNPETHNIEIPTDDRPYPFDIFKDRTIQWKIFKQTSWLALFVVLIPALVIFLARRRENQTIQKQPTGGFGTKLIMLLFFGILGIGYLLIEIVLMQKFAIFLSSPVYALVIVLGTMLISSGIGGYYSAGMSQKKALLAIGAVVAITGLAVLIYSPILQALMFLPFVLRVLAAIILICPLAFFMGMPFPFALSLSKERLTDRHAGLFFGINGALGAISAPLALITSIHYGFNVTIMLGGAAYVMCLILLALIPKAEATSERSKAI